MRARPFKYDVVLLILNQPGSSEHSQRRLALLGVLMDGRFVLLVARLLRLLMLLLPQRLCISLRDGDGELFGCWIILMSLGLDVDRGISLMSRYTYA